MVFVDFIWSNIFEKVYNCKILITSWHLLLLKPAFPKRALLIRTVNVFATGSSIRGIQGWKEEETNRRTDNQPNRGTEKSTKRQIMKQTNGQTGQHCRLTICTYFGEYFGKYWEFERSRLVKDKQTTKGCGSVDLWAKAVWVKSALSVPDTGEARTTLMISSFRNFSIVITTIIAMIIGTISHYRHFHLWKSIPPTQLTISRSDLIISSWLSPSSSSTSSWSS